MSAKHPTLRDLMEAEGYAAGAETDPRVMRFIAKQKGGRWAEIKRLLRKRARRRQRPKKNRHAHD